MATKTKQQVTPSQEQAVPATATSEFDDWMKSQAGQGISNRQEDNIVPQIGILQPLSPAIVNEEFPDAKAGDFIIGNEIVSGQKGIWFQPCHTSDIWFEFAPMSAGGGFVASHEFTGYRGGKPILPPGAVSEGGFDVRMGDNVLLHYKQWAGLLWVNKHPVERIINFKSTGHTIQKQWMTQARERRFDDGTQMGLYTHVYHLTTEKMTNQKGTWFQLKVGQYQRINQAEDIIGNPMVAARMGEALHKAFMGGERQAQAGDVEQSPRQSINDEIPF